MNVSYCYLNFEKLNENKKDKFIRFILRKCNYEITSSTNMLGDFYKDDFIQDISLLILKNIKNKKFRFRKFPSYYQYKKDIINNKFNNMNLVNNFFKKNYKTNTYKTEIILSKPFYKKLILYSYQCSYIAYVKKIIKNERIRYSKIKNQFLSNTVELTNEIINYVGVKDDKIPTINLHSYLSEDEYNLLNLYNIKTQSEISKEFHITQQSVSYRLNKIRKKLKSYEKV